MWGLLGESDEGVQLGSYEYVSSEEPLQYFPAQHQADTYYSHVELKIRSNHGNALYTCIYRFRVHGLRMF